MITITIITINILIKIITIIMNKYSLEYPMVIMVIMVRMVKYHDIPIYPMVMVIISIISNG
jgi:hypothetical protein